MARSPSLGGRRVARTQVALFVVAALVLSLLGGPAASGSARTAAAPMAADRISGADRMATAAAVSATFWPSAETALLATAGNYPDALAAGTLAAATDAPLLLTASDALSPAAAAELERLGVRRVQVLGGEGAVGPAVQQALTAAGYAVERIAGADRYHTAAAVAAEAGAAASGDVVLALGAHADPARAWPDALSAGALASTQDRPPLLLTAGDALPASTREALAALSGGSDRRVLLMGGPAAISTSVESELAELGHTVVRLAGTNRFQTSARAADATLRRMSNEPRPLVLASGANFPDGLAAAALAARVDGVVVLVPPGDLAHAGDLADWLGAQSPRFDRVIVVGGRAAISDRVVDQVAEALSGPVVDLPAPMALPSGSAPEIARALVAEITEFPALGLDRSVAARAAMLTALRFAGLTVLASDGSTVVAPQQGRGQGMAVEAWEAYALADVAIAQRADDLHGVGADLVTIIDDLDGAPVAELLLDGIREAAADPDAVLHGWAWLLVESGRQAPTPHDLLTEAPEQIQLTHLQHALIVRRFVGDVVALVHGYDPSPAARSAQLAGFQQAAATPRPCTTTGIDQAILDYSALTISKAFGKLFELLESRLVPSPDPLNPQNIEKINKWLSRVSAGLDWIQVAVTYGLLEIKVSIPSLGQGDGTGVQPPIVRTPTAEAGDQHDIVTTLRLNTGHGQVLNCFRILLNVLGLDFSLPQDGPVQGAQVNTILHNAGVSGGRRPTLTSAPGQSQFGHVTDADGKVVFGVIGIARTRDLDPDLIIGVDREELFLAEAVLKPPDLLEDFKDIGLSAISGGPAALIKSLTIDLIYRTRWFSSKGTRLAVIDFEEQCPTRFQGFAQEPIGPEEPPAPVCGPGTLTGQISYSWEVSTAPNVEGVTHSGGAHVQVAVGLRQDSANPGRYVDDGTSSFTLSLDAERVGVFDGCTSRVRQTGTAAGPLDGGPNEPRIGYGHLQQQTRQHLFSVVLGYVDVTTTSTREGPERCSPGEHRRQAQQWILLTCPSVGFLYQDVAGLEGTALYSPEGVFTQLDMACSASAGGGTSREVKTVTGILRSGS
jgi:putative cell wall-binding protein